MFKSFFYNSGLLTAVVVGLPSMALAKEESLVTIRLSKEEISSASNPQFIKSRDLSDVLSDKIKLLAATVTARQGGTNVRLVELATASKQLTHEAFMNRQAILHFEGNGSAPADGDGIRLHLLGQTRKSTEVKFKEAFPLFDEIRKGISFKFSLRDKGVPDRRANDLPQIRYGLVAQEIQPAQAPSLASLGTTSDFGPEYSRPAKVVYTIDKIEGDSANARVFSQTPYEITSPEMGTPSSTAQEIFRKPSTDVAFKIEPANSEDSVSDKVGAGSLPGAKVTISQADDLVSAQILTTSKFGKDKITYDTRLPLYGEASLTRKFDEKFKAVQTSAVNLLGNAAAPKLNVHQLNVEEKFKAELLFKRPQLEWGVALEPRQGWTPGSKVGDTGDRLTVMMNKNF